MTTQYKTAVIGLGSMGYGMAQSCIRAGHQVWGRDINPAPMQKLVSEGAQAGDLPSDLNAAVVVVLNAPQTEDVHPSAGAVLYALEMERGWFARKGIRAGDRVEGIARATKSRR